MTDMGQFATTLFQLMKPSDDSTSEGWKNYNNELIRAWYTARHYVRTHIAEWEKHWRGNGNESFRIAVRGGSQLSRALVRHLALMMHYPHFDEDNQSTRSVITILYEGNVNLSKLKGEARKLMNPDYLGNLMKYSDFTVEAPDGRFSQKGLSFLDIVFELKAVKHFEDHKECLLLPDDSLIYKDVKAALGHIPEEFGERDVERGILVNSAYNLGDTINNLPSEDNDTPVRYNIALDYLRGVHRKTRIDDWNRDFGPDGSIHPVKLRQRLSSIFSGDTFESHIRGLMNYYGEINYRYMLNNARNIRSALRENLNRLARTEHARWNAEKLILGFRPLNAEEALEDELALSQRNSRRSALKKRAEDPAHIDIASYRDLKRINPQDMKYDCFIILAIPYILRTNLK